MNTEKLKQAISDRGVSVTAIAKYLGITRVSASNKINGKTEFWQSEIVKLVSFLRLSLDETMDIFFSQE